MTIFAGVFLLFVTVTYKYQRLKTIFFTFQPVTLNVFPALQMVNVRSHIPDNVAERENVM